jgi:arsenite-transporting ATPase
LIGNAEVAEGYDHIVFDTTPTGHTLRLMSLTKAWDQFLESNTSGTSCLGPLAGLEKQRVIYESAIKTLANAELTTLVLVSRPQTATIAEAERTAEELRRLGVDNQCLVTNCVFDADDPNDKIARAMQLRGGSALNSAASFVGSLPSFIVPLRPINIFGVAGLRMLLHGDKGDTEPTSHVRDWKPTELDSIENLVSDFEKRGHGVIMTMGKGGVSKTTVAAAIAVMLAKRGHPVHLTTTDPAAHVERTLSGQVEGLTLSRIDPAVETAAYSAEVMRTQGANMDDAGRALLEEYLRSPCTEVIAVFRAFAREVGQATDRFVVLDTAPTGHTLLLLDASESYHRELERQARSTQPEEVLLLLERLRDPEFTRILLVSLPEATPVHEAAALQDDLRRAQIEPFAWIINQSLLNSGSRDPVLQRREQLEHRYCREVATQHATRVAWLPWQAEEPVGPDALANLAFSNLLPSLT